MTKTQHKADEPDIPRLLILAVERFARRAAAVHTRGASRNHKYPLQPPRTSTRTRDIQVHDSAARIPKRRACAGSASRVRRPPRPPASLHPIRGHVASALLRGPRAPHVTWLQIRARALGGNALLLNGQTARDIARQLHGPDVRRWSSKELIHADCVCGLYGTRRVRVLLCAREFGKSTRAKRGRGG